MNARPIQTITLITDFGLQDGHVGAMKGVIRSIAPHVEIVDISHYIEPQDIRHGGFVLMTAYPYWPPDTIHVIVVDPGVGTRRRAIAVQTPRGTFIAPDNGVLSYVLAHQEMTQAVQLTNPDYWHHPASPVFHGRDIFAPTAAYLALGTHIRELGQVIQPDALVILPVPQPKRHPDGQITAHIQHIDRFGNCTTDLPGTWLEDAPHWQIEVQGQQFAQVHQTFGQVPLGNPVLLVDSTGFLCVAVRNGNAAQTLDLQIGTLVRLWPKQEPT